MDLYYSEGGNVIVLIIKYLDKVLRKIPEEIGPPTVLLLAEYLLLVREMEMPGFCLRRKLESSIT